MYYRGRDMMLTHRAWASARAIGTCSSVMPQRPWQSSGYEAEQREVVAFVQSLKKEIVEA